MICFRHTLEQITPTWEFMRTLRRTIGDQMDILVFFELPDIMRVLREGAFWDIYYEHCSYFTSESLTKLFMRAGFEPIKVSEQYDGQFLTIDA